MAEQSPYGVDQGYLLVTFQVEGSYYGLETTWVQEVVLVGAVTRVHHAPEYVRGIINLRGKIVTVIDLAQKLQDNHAEISPESRILITLWNEEYVGLLVDSIEDVLSLDKTQVETNPSNVSDHQSKFIEGVYRGENRVVAILNAEELLA